MTNLDLIDGIYYKREDQNPSGSIKDRWLSQKIKPDLEYVISSSGNAAISAQYYSKKVTVFISPKTSLEKQKLLNNVHFSDKPISQAFKYAKNNHLFLLRQSSDPQAIKAYFEVGTEIKQQLPQITSIFIPVGSGTTLLGISKSLPLNVKLFAVQPAASCPIASFFDDDFQPEKETLTDSLGVKYLPLKKQVINAINDHQGSGIVIQNAELKHHYNLTNFCPETALCLAGLFKARKNFQVGEYPVILVTGVRR